MCFSTIFTDTLLIFCLCLRCKLRVIGVLIVDMLSYLISLFRSLHVVLMRWVKYYAKFYTPISLLSFISHLYDSDSLTSIADDQVICS